MRYFLRTLFCSIIAAGSALTLVGAKPGAHGNHTAKYGGQFFMAPDGVHHLEATMATSRELRVYFYDAHTHPVSTVSFYKGARVETQKVGPDGRETGTPIKLTVVPDPSNTYLSVVLPKKLKLPLYFSAWFAFPGYAEPELFNFLFEK